MMELPGPRQAEKVYGHQSAENLFKAAMGKGRLHHAWLISGPSGIGKATLAYRLARYILHAENMQSPAGRRVSAETHGDLLVISRSVDQKKGRLRSEITVADVRPIQDFLHHTPTEGGWRVVIVDGMEFLNRFAANALLKILEEPPQKAILLLTTSAPGTLLPTLRSRCRSLSLSPLVFDAMVSLLPDIDHEILRKAEGSPGRALFLARDQHGFARKLVHDVMRGRAMDPEMWDMINRISRETDGFALLCDLLGGELAQAAHTAARSGELAQAAFLAAKTEEVARLWKQTENLNLDKAQSVRQVLAMVNRSGSMDVVF